MTGFSAELLTHFIDRLDVGVLILDRDMNVQLWNQFMSANSGRSAEEVVGGNIMDLFPELPQRWFKKKIDSVFILKNRSFTAWQQRPYLFQFSHNRPVTGGLEYMYQNCTFIPLKNSDGEVESVCITLQDVTDEGISQKLLQETMSKLEISSRTDGLTQLLNRSYWQYCLSRECKRSIRYNCKTSLIMFDLDHFKSINDTYGHLAGDEVLRRVSDVLKETVRDTDIAGRYGGEEFGVVVSDSDLKAAEGLAERIRKAIASLKIVYEGQMIPVTVSLGVAEYHKDIPSHEKLIGQADAALYRAKKSGRNSWVSHRPE